MVNGKQKLEVWRELHGGKLNDFINEFTSIHKMDINVVVPTKKLENIDGFSVIVISTPKNTYDKKYMPKFIKGLEIFKKRVSSVFPELLKIKIPFYLDFSNISLEHGGSFDFDKITIYVGGLMGTVENIAVVVAHEMGHAYWHKIMRKDNQKAWYQYITGKTGNLDLTDVLRQYGDEKFLYDNKKIKEDDPIKYLKIQGLFQGSWKNVFQHMLKMSDLKKYLAGNPDKNLVAVSLKPITGYAASNSDEAFCEALALWIIHGNSALDPENLYVLKNVIGY